MNLGIELTKEYNFNNASVIIGNKEKVLTIKQINEVNRLLSLKSIKSKKQYFQKIFTTLNAMNLNINDLIRLKHKEEYLSYLKKEILFSKSYLTNYFIDVLPLRLQLFEKIVNLENCEITHYDHNTVTGRLKVIKGTNYLTMKESSRKLLKHKNKNRIIQEIDFKSCEPNFYLKYKEIDFNGSDVYSFIMKKLNIDVDRSNFKRGVLSIIYGAHESTVSKISKIPVNKVKKIKEFFDIENFSNDLEKEHKENGFIKNFYGRPLLSKNNLVNHWIQSSAADYCCLAFREFVLNNKNVELHGVIHDAVIISSETLIDTDFLKENISNFNLPVTVKKLTDN